MEQKALLFKDPGCATKIMEASSPREMKNIASSISRFQQSMWEERVPDIMFQGLKERFRQNPKAAELLKKTDSGRLVEASPTDKFWQIGIYMFSKDIVQKKELWGTNMLGKVLIKVRDIISIDSTDDP